MTFHQVRFDEWQTKKTCTIIINDDSIFEGRETFYVELIDPSFTLIGENMKIAVTIDDLEDGMRLCLFSRCNEI